MDLCVCELCVWGDAGTELVRKLTREELSRHPPTISNWPLRALRNYTSSWSGRGRRQ